MDPAATVMASDDKASQSAAADATPCATVCTGSELPDEEREVDVLDALADTPDGFALLAGHALPLKIVIR